MSLPIAFENAGVPASVETLAKAMGQASISDSGALNGRDLLKMDKRDGAWVFGQEGVELDGLIAINPGSFQHGYISWAAKGGAILGEAMAHITQPLPTRVNLPNTGEKWDEQLMFEAQIVDGEDAGTPLVYKTTAHGGKEFVRTIMRRIVGQMGATPDFIVPIVKLKSTNYQHKSYGLVYKPDFKIESWVNFSGASQNAQLEAPDIEETVVATGAVEAAEEPPARRRGRASAATAEPEPEAPPARRRGHQTDAPAEPADTPPPRRRRRA